MAHLGTAFLPVNDPIAAAEWYSQTFGFTVSASYAHSAVLENASHECKLTLLGPASGISAEPGLPWATHNLIVDNLEQFHTRISDAGVATSGINGDEQTCNWFTMLDPDGNTLRSATDSPA